MKNLFKISVLILLIILIHSCKKDKPTPPIITTTAVSEISYTTATSGGEVTNEGGDPVISRGICWNTAADPTISNSKTSESGGLGTFTSNITLLTPNTTYYVRAYATNTAGTGYGESVTFTTLQVAVPVLTTTAITTITQTSAVSGGNITDDKGGAVSARGVCWGTTTNPTIANSKTTDATGTGSFVSNLTGLVPATTYNVRAYATNSAGIVYGNEISFTSSPVLVTGVTINLTTISITKGETIQLTASILPSNATNKNVTWSSANSSIATVSTSGLVTAVNLGSTTIIVTSENGGFSSSCIVNVIPFSQIGVTYVAVDGLSVNLNSLIITSTASTYRYTINYTLVNKTLDKAIDEGYFKMHYANKSGGAMQYGSFATLYPGGTRTRTYTFEEFKSDPFGILEYDNLLKWEVKIPIGQSPTVTTSAASNITTNSATINGIVNPNGYSSVVTFDYGTTTSYGATITATQSPISGSNLTNVSADLTGLIIGTTYHYRVRAENSGGTSLGSDISFIASTIPTLTTSATTSVTQTTASSGGNITSDGGASVTARGVCWSTSSNPTTGNSKTTNGTGTGSFTSSITGLTANTKYYLKAYATNSAGTSYGDEVSFTTSPILVSSITLNATSITLQSSGTSQITATVLPSNASDKTVSWISSNTTVASVSSTGLVTALAKGTTTITAQTNDGGKTVTCEIIVAQLLSGIINSNLDLGEDNVVALSGIVQIASGVTLTVGQGTVIYGTGYEIHNFGNFFAMGTIGKKITIKNLKLVPKTGNFVFNLQYCVYTSGSIYSPTGNAIYGQLILKNNEFYNLSSYFYLWYPIADCLIEGNIFDKCGGFSIGVSNGIKVTIKNNRFVNMTRWSIELWANYGAAINIIVQKNSFMDTGVVQIKIPGGGYAGKDIDASNNYWNTTSSMVISMMIFDKNDDLSSPGIVLFTPFLTSPDPITP